MLLFSVLSQWVLARGIVVSNVSLSDQDSTAGYSLVRFDISWFDSWRYSAAADINSWDAAWVFVKFRVGGVDYLSAAGATNTGNVITVNTTTGLRPGMALSVSTGTGEFPAQARVVSIISDTQFEASEAPTTPLSAGAVVLGSRPWEHAWLGNSGEHTPGTGSSAVYESGLKHPDSAYQLSSNPALGVFIYRNSEGYGALNISNIGLRWNYAVQSVGHNDVVEVQVYAIEMVYVPEGAFELGDSSISNVRGHFRDADANIPFRILSDGVLTLGGSSAGQLGNNHATGMSSPDDYDNSTTQSLPAAFPTGYTSWYAMKYEISQQQYVDFLNSLNRLQQQQRTATDLSPGLTSISNRYVLSGTVGLQNRNGIRCDATISASAAVQFYCDLNGNGTGAEADDGMFIACNYLSWADLAAYADWSALRPITETAYEKLARGQRMAIRDGYAWATSDLLAAEAIASGGTASEAISTSGANAVFNNESGVQGPVRVGAFADTAITREAAGAGFWGAMELSGNLAERLVSTGHPSGRAFTGQHGDGALIDTGNSLALYGNANTVDWPPANGDGHGLRGGNWASNDLALRISDRLDASAGGAGRSANAGGRLARSISCSVPSGTAVVTGDSIPAGGTAVFTASGAGSAYWWIVPPGWEVVSGQGTATVTIYAEYPSVLRVAPYNDCGSGEEVRVTVTVD
ncbi:MAG: SUMF1/EgtB/PvdO family nonheme iron enzyme [Bacteroidia bacterium]